MKTHSKADTAFGQSFTADQLMSDSSIKRINKVQPPHDPLETSLSAADDRIVVFDERSPAADVGVLEDREERRGDVRRRRRASRTRPTLRSRKATEV